MRTLRVVLGDQLDAGALAGLDPSRDALWMAEVASENTHVWCHQQRILMFLTAMRHFRDARRAEGWTVHYRELEAEPDKNAPPSHAEALAADLEVLAPGQVNVLRPGDLRVEQGLVSTLEAWGGAYELLEDPHFIATADDFLRWAKGRKRLVLEHWYRHLRKREGILMEADGTPTGGEWNYDAANRKSFGRKGPPPIPPLPGHRWDETTEAVADLVRARFGDHPGELESFDLPVTPEEAERLAQHVMRHVLPNFGPQQDAMWSDDVILWHSRLSAPLNLKLISPRRLVDLAVAAHADGQAAIEGVEGFVRQILGWREFIRGIYVSKMPDYAEFNALECEDRDVPSFFWDGETDMACVKASMAGLLRHGYVHHIHRLMVLGLFSMQIGVHPYRFHAWHMAMYLDAVDWVSLPNALGMSQYGDGGVVGTKPYAATGKYIKRMSNYCQGCRYDPELAVGEAACPFTTTYWDFLNRHRAAFDANPRMRLQVKNLERKSAETLAEIRERAQSLTDRMDAGERI